jgi:hypothetical protein
MVPFGDVAGSEGQWCKQASSISLIQAEADAPIENSFVSSFDVQAGISGTKRKEIKLKSHVLKSVFDL